MPHPPLWAHPPKKKIHLSPTRSADNSCPPCSLWEQRAFLPMFPVPWEGNLFTCQPQPSNLCLKCLKWVLSTKKDYKKKRGGGAPRSNYKAVVRRMWTGGKVEWNKTFPMVRPDTSLLLSQMSRQTCFTVQCRRSYNHESWLNRPTGKPRKAHNGTSAPYKRKTLNNLTSPYISLGTQIKHITTSWQKYASQLNKSLEIPKTSLQGEHISTVKHSPWKLHSPKVI